MNLVMQPALGHGPRAVQPASARSLRGCHNTPLMPTSDANGLPRLPGRMVVRTDPDRAIDALLADLFIHANNCVRAFGDFHLAVSATPASEPALMRLMYDPPYREFPWKRTRLWMVDELDLPAEHPDLRGPRLAETLVALSGLPESQFHPIEYADTVEPYRRLLGEHLGWREKGHDRLDFVFLTVEPDGELSGVGESPVPRVVIPPEFIRSARFVAVFAPGPHVNSAVAGLAARARDGTLGLAPVGGELAWYVAVDPLKGEE